MVESVEQGSTHPIFLKDPKEWMHYVHKEVCVLTEVGSKHSGWVYTIDPVSESVMLIQFSDADDTMSLETVVGHAVKEISILNESIPECYRNKLEALFRPEVESKLTADQLKDKLLCVKMWLEKNRLPVQLTGERCDCLTIADVLTIQAPYEPENCISTNEIILGRIQGLMKNMPRDHQQW